MVNLTNLAIANRNFGSFCHSSICLNMSFFTGFLAFINGLKNAKYKYFSAFALSLFLIIVSTTTFAARDFIVENRTAALFVVNGTTGNIFMAPNFGNVGIGMTVPASKLEVAGTFNATSSSTQMLLNSNGDVTINLKG